MYSVAKSLAISLSPYVFLGRRISRSGPMGRSGRWNTGPATFSVELAECAAAAAIAWAVVDSALGAFWLSTFLLSGELLGGGEEGCVRASAAGGCEAGGGCEVWATIWAMASTMSQVCSGLALAACSCTRTEASTVRLVGGAGSWLQTLKGSLRKHSSLPQSWCLGSRAWHCVSRVLLWPSCFLKHWPLPYQILQTLAPELKRTCMKHFVFPTLRNSYQEALS